jgi:hypothetical protein
MVKFLSLFFMFFTSLSFADTHCTGQVDVVGVSRTGNLLVRGPGGLPDTYLCNVEAEMNGVLPEVCRTVYSTLLTAQAQRKPVHVTFSPALGSIGCSGVNSWGWAANFNWVLLYK